MNEGVLTWGRAVQSIKGNVINDVMLSVVLYPLVAVQMHDEALAAQNERPAVVVPQPEATRTSTSSRRDHDDHIAFPGPPVGDISGGFVRAPSDRR